MKISSAAIALLGLALAGCQSGPTEKDFVGNWSSKLTVSDADLMAQLKTFGGTEKDLPQIKKLMENVTVTMDLKENKTFKLSSGSGGDMEGKWAFANPKVTLTPEKIGGMTVDELKKKMPQAASQGDPMVLDVSKDGKNLTGKIQKIAQVNFAKAATEAKK